MTGSRWMRVRRCALRLALLALALAQSADALIVVSNAEPIRFAWSPASGAPADYLVSLSTNGGPFNAYAWVTGTSVEIPAQPDNTIAIAVAASGRDANGALYLGPQSPVSELVRVMAAIGFPVDGEWMLHCASCPALALRPLSDASQLLEEVAAPPAPWRVLDHSPLWSGADFLVWQNADTGELRAWHSLTPVNVVGGFGPAAARSVGSADFDGDGSAELLIEDTNTGEISLWALSSSGFARVAAITGPARMRLAAARDFDRNGTIDLIWQHELGLVQTWSVLRDPKQGSLEYIASGVTKLVPVGTGIVDSGDYDGDGDLDLLWRSRYGEFGRLAITYFIDGVADRTVLLPARGDDALQRVVGSIDINGLPGDEIVLQNDQTGAITVQVTSNVRFVVLQPGAAWSLAGVRR